MTRIRPRATGLAAVLAGAALLLAGCSEAGLDDGPGGERVLQEARSVNQSRHVAEHFESHPVVLDDEAGFTACELFYPSSEVLILADETPAAQLRAASLAVVAHAPMLIYNSEHHAEVIRQIERMSTHTVYTVGDVPVLGYTDKLKVIRDPGGREALEKATALGFAEKEVADEKAAAEEVAALRDGEPVWLRATYGPRQHVPEDAENGVVPVRSRQDAEMAPQVIALSNSSLASIATARAFGANVYVTDNPDPRVSHKTLLLTAGLSDLPLVALGDFGTSVELGERIREAEAGVLPGELDNIASLPQVSD